MKRFVFIMMVMSFCNILSGQVCTPNGSWIAAYQMEEQMTSAEKEALRQNNMQIYPRAIYMGEPTTTYNCHGYAWSMTEGGEKICIYSPDVQAYMLDGSYTQTISTDSKATKVWYGSNVDHSAVVSMYSGYLISKWGTWCLMRHLPADCPYIATTLTYYKLSMEITGDEIVALPTNSTVVIKTYTLTNLPNGATVDWEVTGRGSIVSGQGSAMLGVALNGTGNTTIKAKVNCPTGLVVNIPFNLEVRASSAPIITDIEMFKYSQDSGEFTLKAATNQPEGTFTWSIFGGNAELYDIPNPDDAMFMLEPNTYKAVRFYDAGTYTITVTGSKAGTMDTYTYSKNFYVSEVVSNNW